ncbi:MAG: hypothetical protein ABGW78_16305 [Pirellulales bacterium]
MSKSTSVLFIVCGLLFFTIPNDGYSQDALSNASSSPEASVNILDAEAQGLVVIKYIANNAQSAQIVIENKTKKPLTLQLPAAFAGVPILAQMGMGGMGGMGGGMGGMGGGAGGGLGAAAAQSTGGGGMGGMQGGMGGMQGGMGGMQGGMGGMGGMGGGMFAIPPEKVKVVRVATVCLEYGKPEPNQRMPYKLVEVTKVSSSPHLSSILQALGRGQISQKVAQAAAWHITDGLSWSQLASEKIDRAGGYPDERFFSPAELMAAYRVVEWTDHMLKKQKGVSQAVKSY